MSARKIVIPYERQESFEISTNGVGSQAFLYQQVYCDPGDSLISGGFQWLQNLTTWRITSTHPVHYGGAAGLENQGFQVNYSCLTTEECQSNTLFITLFCRPN